MKTPDSTRARKGEKKPERNAGRAGDSRKDLISAFTRAEKTIKRLQKLESKRKIDQEGLEQVTHALRERVKELNCMYSISSLVERYSNDLDKLLQHTVAIIPGAWQYPEITCCSIHLDGMVIKSRDFQETPWRLSQNISVNGKVHGALDVYYREEKPVADEGPFLAEERSLINVIAERIGMIVERKYTEDALTKSESKNAALLNAIPDLMFQIDEKGTLVGLHSGTFMMIQNLEDRLIGKSIYCLADEEELLPRRLIDYAMLFVKRALETGNPQVFEHHTSVDGKGRDYEVRMVVCRKEEVLGIVRDITRRKRLEREILEISNREQRRIGQDLHDSLCQHLAGIGFMGKVLEKKVSSQMPLETVDVREIVDLIDQAITLTKGYARGLNPIEIEAEGLMIALDKLAENMRKLFGVTCSFTCETPIYIHDIEMAINLYRIVQEALNNSINHGRADNITIRLEKNGPACTLRVRDNGVGIGRTRQSGKGMGMNIMRYRASMFGASLDIRSREGSGTEIVCTFQISDGQ